MMYQEREGMSPKQTSLPSSVSLSPVTRLGGWLPPPALPLPAPQALCLMVPVILIGCNTSCPVPTHLANCVLNLSLLGSWWSGVQETQRDLHPDRDPTAVGGPHREDPGEGSWGKRRWPVSGARRQSRILSPQQGEAGAPGRRASGAGDDVWKLHPHP